MGHKKDFDPTDRRCIFPKFGKAFDAAMTAKGLTNSELAKRIGVDHTAIAGYRRGFSRPMVSEKMLKLGRELGIKLNMSEPRPSQIPRLSKPKDETKPSSKVEGPKPELPPALTHLAAIALDYGYMTSFTRITA